MHKELWLHGTKTQLTVLKEDTTFQSDYCNAGLGLFLTQEVEIAKQYAHNGYIATLEVDRSKCYKCNEDEFWCRNEPFNEDEDIDPLGNYINLPGSKTRKALLDAGYTTLIYTDKEMGDVLVLLNKNAAKIVNCVDVSTKYTKKFK
jgi:hypothetical protein